MRRGKTQVVWKGTEANVKKARKKKAVKSLRAMTGAPSSFGKKKVKMAPESFYMKGSKSRAVAKRVKKGKPRYRGGGSTY